MNAHGLLMYRSGAGETLDNLSVKTVLQEPVIPHGVKGGIKMASLARL